MDFEPGMPRAAPAEVFLGDAVEVHPFTAFEAKHGRKCDLTRVVQSARIVAEAHLTAANTRACAVGKQ